MEANPSARDSRFYLESFAPPASSLSPKPPRPDAARSDLAHFPISENMPTTATFAASSVFTPDATKRLDAAVSAQASVVDSLLEPLHQHTGLVKIQGPFTDRQLESIADGMIYLKRLGLVSIIVIDSEDWPRQPGTLPVLPPSDPFSRPGGGRGTPSPSGSSDGLRRQVLYETQRLAEMLEERGGEARPLLEGLLRLGDDRGTDGLGLDLRIDSLEGVRSAIRRREIPVVPPLAVNSSCASVCVPADEALKALARGLAPAGSSSHGRGKGSVGTAAEGVGSEGTPMEIDLTPLRLMIINREGGIPSPARGGDPHLSINLASEYSFIQETFRWQRTHPTSLQNLDLMRACLDFLPRESSGVIVSHRSPKSLIANLVTNRPAHSPSLKHATLLSRHHDVGPATPTLVRKGLEIRVVRGFESLDLHKMTKLLEQSFGKRLDENGFYSRLQRTMDFAIIAGDYQGAAIVTLEADPADPTGPKTAYLDKFAVLPSLQGEGTVDFLWGALRDESFGLGSQDALNNNGGLGGKGTPMDLVWRSRTENPVNRWYWERSNGSLKIGKPKGSKVAFSMFWCYAEGSRDVAIPRADPVSPAEVEVDGEGLRPRRREGEEPVVDPGGLSRWTRTLGAIPSCWK